MKPPVFDYHAPLTLAEALQLLTDLQEPARLLAGGQSLMPMLNQRLIRPAHVVDINGLAELETLRMKRHWLAVGALVRQRTAELSNVVRQQCPLLAEVLPFMGHVQIRNRGTIAGSLANADPRAELPLVATVLEPGLVLRSTRGERTLKPSEFFVGRQTTTCRTDEILVEVRVPIWPAGAGWSYQSVSRRQGDLAIVGAAALVQLAPDGRAADVRLALAGVADVPVRAHTAEASLAGEAPTGALVVAAAQRAAANLAPIDDVLASRAYRQSAVQALAERALRTAIQRAGGNL
jgi:CO/xanthine dehydrogenase FAD-binding subunit